MSSTIPYKNFPKYILRAPVLSYSSYKKLTSKLEVSNDDLKKYCCNPIFKEAIFLASPILYEEMDKWLNNKIKDKKREAKVKYSILKYISRMSSRCTPFGLFAGCAVGTFERKTNIELSGANQNNRLTRLDMNYLVALSQKLVQIKNIKKQILFYPNTSIYVIGESLRYIEYSYLDNKRFHKVIETNRDEYLDKILFFASKGCLLEELSNSLVDSEISYEEASGFVNELVACQFLVSELEPSVSGPQFLKQIISVLEKLNGVDKILKILQKVNQSLIKIDQSFGNNPNEYIELSNYLKELGADFELGYLFQTDISVNTENNVLDIAFVEDIKKALALFNRLTKPRQNSFFNQFLDAFYDRYEEREVPLSLALDVETGLGYKQHLDSGDLNPLVDDLKLPNVTNEYSQKNYTWTETDKILQKKIIAAVKENSFVVSLTDEDFDIYNLNWDDLPDTMSCLIEVINKGERKIKFTGIGGSSAANLLGRFCFVDMELFSYVQEIIKTETKINKNKILAEIVHLPEARVGNILMRPELRDFEIPYLAKSLKPFSNQFSIDELMISINSRKEVTLRCGDKKIFPRLTCAHNYSNNSLPIYHFLCDMQNQGKRNAIGLNVTPHSERFEFLPRIEYNNVIIQSAMWNLRHEHIVQLLQAEDDNKFSTVLELFKEKWMIPQFILLVDEDNELLVNSHNLTCVRMLLDTVKNRPQFRLMEFLFGDDTLVKCKGESYTNQVVASFYNKNKLDVDKPS